ncbi:MAG TPA: hypothetical protein VK459_27480 [Polyangiaceae bacterium]|nr:hypothetical protein [Polyangiaceae bacterium]
MSEEAVELRGWESISKRAKMSVKTARARALYGAEHRLPVWVDHKGTAIALASAIDQWLKDERRPYGSIPYGSELRFAHVSHRLPTGSTKRLKIKRIAR